MLNRVAPPLRLAQNRHAVASMIDWIEWTKCPTCGYAEKEVFQKPDDASQDHQGDHASPGLPCPKCGNRARRITFPVFEIETIDVSMSGDAFRDEMEDW